MPITWNITFDAATWKVGASPAFATAQDLATANAAIANVTNDIGLWSTSTGTVNFTATVQAAGGGASTSTFIPLASYAAMKSMFAAIAPQDRVKASAYASLPASNPFGTPTIEWTTGLQSIINNSNSGTSDGQIWIQRSGLGTDSTRGSFAYEILLHEITEVLCRVSLVDLLPSFISILDYFSYSAPHVRASTTTGRYFSWDDGVTNFGNYNGTAGSDFGDWAGGGSGLANTTTSPFLRSIPSIPAYTRVGDLQLLDCLGIPLSAAGLQAAGIGGSMSSLPTMGA